ncbi:DUF3570 domain-containing protein [Hymenobacter psychrophilus]|uniref:DUF3570 domain-containing protein n=1 Tax=Hymenobacter psychrophilus TaxID=651662 RepID=A0A1H3CTV2_9BACT|nr:DUF3570 domain-containing protein [Hymenobacter psychrophilus]SDX57545.1 Protein of unknown function [Hymenobacter psychrophilus]
MRLFTVLFRPARVLPVVLSLLPSLAWAQGGVTPNRIDGSGVPLTPQTNAANAQVGETEVNILGSYYQQDGTHGAVQGGRGTEYLTDVTPTIILNIPLDTVSRLTANIGADFYASASTDRIDGVEGLYLSTPSSRDTRIHADFGYSRENRAKHRIVGLGAGVSKEYDYFSVNVVGSWAKSSRDGNREFSAAGQVYLDQAKLIYPIELRTGQQLVPTDKRQSYNLSMVYSQVLSQRLQVALSTELVYQHGLLSTSFHRVYFREPGITAPKVEQLPQNRFKYPVALRVSYFASDFVQLRGFYRFYNDNFGITAHTFELETPIKVTPFFVLYPFYRYHNQTAAKYFAAYAQHSIAEQYYTSDYDLSAFSANKYGLGLRYSPVYGISRFKTPFGNGQGGRRVAKFKSLDVRYAYYQRNNNFNANLISFDLAFVMP